MTIGKNIRRKISVLRIGHRFIRDDRTTTHAGLVARAFGCNKIYMTDVSDDIKNTIDMVNERWGGAKEFKIEVVNNWKKIIKEWKENGGVIVHLTMYGISINDEIDEIKSLDKNILVIIGAEKVPKEIYFLSDHNIAIGNQPHSEIAALAVFLDRIHEGEQFNKKFSLGKMKIVPSKRGKNVIKVS